MLKKQFTIPIMMVAFILIATACGSSSNKTVKEDVKMEPSVIEVSIGGMTCTGCEQTIQRRVGELEGIKSVKASYVAGSAIIEFFPDKVDSLKIRDAITGSGYSVNKFTIPSN